MQSNRTYWEEEERLAVMHGWDFSHIEGRYDSGDDRFPWDFRSIIDRYRTPEMQLLDMETGGGEFLLSLHHPPQHTAATEGWAPNIALCRERLLPLGIEFRPMTDPSQMPFDDGTFDIITNRHGSYDPGELYRVLKTGGVFVTQQVGGQNELALRERLLPGTANPFAEFDPAHETEKLTAAGLTVTEQDEVFLPIRFFDTGALVWFAKVIEWEFPGFSVERCFDALCGIEREIQETGCVQAEIHRFRITAKKEA